MGGSRSGARFAIVLPATLAMFAACGSLEGLDKYTLGTAGEDASAGGHGPPPDATAADDAAEAGSATESGNDNGDAGDGAAIEEGGSDDAGDASDAAFAEQGDSGCVCVSAAPAGWSGFVQLGWGDAGASSCAAPYAAAQSQVIAGVADASAQCTACTCSPPPSGPIICQVQLGSGGFLCGGETMTAAPQGLCVPTNGTNGDSYGPAAVPAPVGTCPASGGSATRPPVQTTAATVCVLADAGSPLACESSGQVCVTPPASRAAAAATKLCIFQAGVHTCPSAYSATYVVSTAVTDGRECAPCSCAAPGCPADGYVQGFTAPGCTGTPAATFAADAGCVLGQNANGSTFFLYTPSHSAWNGGCAPQGGGPTGAATLDTSGATTYCCMP